MDRIYTLIPPDDTDTETFEPLPPVDEPPPERPARSFVFPAMLIAAAIVGAMLGMLLVYSTDLPQISELEKFRPSTTTEVFDDQGHVIGSFALQRRVIASYEDFPKVLRDAIISTEDKDFDRHWGINFWRVLGAAYRDATTKSRSQGASTLTMQLARNLFLSPERSFGRKMQEAILSIQIERRFTKQQIFAMYANQIYLGHGVYGFEAGSQYYFSKHAKDLTLEEAALLAGLPKGPNYYSPITYPERALQRRSVVLNSMLEDGKITAQEAARAKEAPLGLNIEAAPNSYAPYFIEEVRRFLERKYGAEEVHTTGLRVYTTLDLDLQRAAQNALLDGLAACERRHGWKGNLRNMLATGVGLHDYVDPDWDVAMEPGTYVHALVIAVSPSEVLLKAGPVTARLGPADWKWTGVKNATSLLKIGDIAYIHIAEPENPASFATHASDIVAQPHGFAHATLEQDSGLQGSILAIDNSTGDIKAMAGGRDFAYSKFNRVTQALRQVGSSFKPYVYTAAVADGARPDDMIVDAPTTFSTSSGPYTPRNFDGRYMGAITLRKALAQSRNIPALKLAQRVGIHTVIDYAHRFGISSTIPPFLPIALGSAEATLYDQVAAYAVFPNDGVRVTPRLVRKVTDYDGHVLEEDYPEVKDVVKPEIARTMTDLLSGVVERGTAFRATELQHPVGGKTGTTNEYTDAWFVGFSPSVTCGVWIGFDEKKTMGSGDTGGHAALPIWVDFMRVAIEGHKLEHFPGVITPFKPVDIRKAAREAGEDTELH